MLNGEKKQVQDNATISSILTQGQLLPVQRTAVLLNGEIMDRDRLNEKILKQGDEVEVIAIAAGG